MISNHGGRQLDGCISPLEILAETRARISAPIMVDSGFRRGSDIVKALALGANAVLLGRSTLYGLAAAGEAGVDHVLRLLKDEVDRTLAQIGCPTIDQLSPDVVAAEVADLTVGPSSKRRSMSPQSILRRLPAAQKQEL